MVKQLKVTLLGAAPKARTTDPEAYALYLQAVQLGRQSTAEAFEQSDALFRKVLAIDPRYAPAWDGLARNFINEASHGRAVQRGGVRPGARGGREGARDRSGLRAGARPPRLYRDVRRQRPRRRRASISSARWRWIRRISTCLRNSAALLETLGRLDEALALEEAVVRRDPVNVTALFNLGYRQRWPASSTRRSRRTAPC